MKGSHKVTVSVEIDGGEGAFTQTQEFSSGNPIFHASEFINSMQRPLGRLKKALEAVYGVRPEDRGRVGQGKLSDLADRFSEAQRAGARVYRLVLVLDRTTYYSEAMYRHQLDTEWEKVQNECTEIEYGVPGTSGKNFDYTWHTL